jgi:cytochrome c oxidase cbb3-type subunit 2
MKRSVRLYVTITGACLTGALALFMAQDSGAQSTDSKSDPFAGAVETTDNVEDPFASDGAELSENSEPPEESDESDDWGDDDDGFGDFGGDPFGESNEGAASSAGSGPVVAPAVLPAPSSLLNKKLLNAELLDRGKVVYKQHCSGCHGIEGNGNGPGAYGLLPKPRDFTTGVYKFRSTPTGYLPTDEDLFRSIRQGVLGASMPGYGLMPERDVLAVAQYLKVFSEAWKDADKYAAPLSLPGLPAWFHNDNDKWSQQVAVGKELYTTYCGACHGDAGDGKGAASGALVDNWNHPIKPADLRKAYIRSGRNLSDVFKAITTGLDGTPMVSFRETLTEEERWSLVAYIDAMRLEYYEANRK